ncbi:MAG: response regulator transcription factor [Chloroflexi bacterium]|nr:response regulator transcription factor [Chloroflexota bacterium]
MAADQSVLIVEDEENLLAAVKYNLDAEGYRVHTASDGASGLAMARTLKPDLVILDLMLPRLDGLEVCRALRRGSDVPILILTARGEEIDRVVGLELGADDYVTKPFSMRELLARVRALLRRPRLIDAGGDGSRVDDVLRSGDLEIDLVAHVVRRGGAPLDMKPREYDLLAMFAANPGRAFSRSVLLDRLWATDYVGDERTVDVHVRWLRQKIEDDSSNPKRIVTIRGLGYRFDA